MEKVYVTKENTATFICNSCERATTVDVTKYLAVNKRVKVKIKCACGASFNVVLEKRRMYRKSTNLPGSFYFKQADGNVMRGAVTIMDLSSNGMKLKFASALNFQSEDCLEVEFRLDDTQRSFVKKKVIIKNMKNNLAGAAFHPHDANDPAIGFYLLS